MAKERRVNWYLVRHGEIEANIQKIYAGLSPEGLTPRGRRQAGAMAQKLLDLGIDRIYCSPVARAVETAEIIGARLHKKPVLMEAFQEIGLGPWAGLSEDEVQRSFPEAWQLWNSRPAELILEGRESLPDLLRRVLLGMAAIQAANGHGSVLIVSHVAIIRVLLLYWQELDLNLYRTLPVPHGEIFTLPGFKKLAVGTIR